MTNIFQKIAYTAQEPNLIGRLVGELFEALGGTGKYWLTVILFTLFLKILTSPLDYWQRLTGKKNALKLERIKPQIEALQKKYAEDKQALNMKQNELYKSVGYSPMGACLPMLLTIAIMIYMFTGLNTFATYKQVEEFNSLQAEYYNAVQIYTDDFFDDLGKPQYKVKVENVSDATGAFDQWYYDIFGNPVQDLNDPWWEDYYDEWSAFTEGMISVASAAVEEFYQANNESFLWIKNIWRSDNFWTTPVPNSDDFKQIAGNPADFDEIEYDNIMREIAAQAGTANGYLILPLLAMVLVFFSTKITSRNQQTGMPQNDTMKQQGKMMQWMMPVMMGVFGLMYTSAVALYMVMNSIYSVSLSFLINWIVAQRMKQLEAKTQSRPGYRR